MLRKALLYEVNLSTRYRNGSRVEVVRQAKKKHPWSGKMMYGLYRFSSTRPVVLFVPTAGQRAKIKSRSGIIRIYSNQTDAGTGLGL